MEGESKTAKLFLSLSHVTTQINQGRQVDLDVYYSRIVS